MKRAAMKKAKAKPKFGVVPTAREINEEHNLAKSCAETAVEHAIRCGQMLIVKKDEVGHGNFTAWVEKECSFSERTARVYMSAAKQKANAIAFSSLRQFFPAASKPAASKPKSLIKKKSTPQNGSALPFSDVRDGPADTDLRSPQGESALTPGEASPKELPCTSKVARSEPKGTAIESPASIQKSIDDERWEPDHDEDEALALAEKELAASVDKVMQSDDRLAAAHAEIKRQAAEIADLKIARNGFMNGKNAINDMLKKEQRKVENLQKQLKRAEAELEKLRERIAIMETA